MMLRKLLGTSILLLIGVLSARRSVHAEKEREALLDAWIRLLYEIRTEIDCFSLPIQEILARTDRQVLQRLGADEPPDSLASLYRLRKDDLDPDTSRLLTSLIGEIGSCYRDEQVKRCDYYLAQLEKGRQELRARLPVRIKLSMTLSLCLSLGGAILLW